MSIINGLVHAVDFSTSLPSTNMMKGLYAGTVGARIGAARSKEELREVATRDIPGWVTFFYGASVIQNVVGYVLDKLTPSSANGVSLIKGPGSQKNFLSMLNPLTKYRVRSFDDVKALKDTIDPKNYKDLMRNKSTVFVIGMAVAIAILGLFIPWLNVQITRKQMLNQDQGKKDNGAMKFSPALNMTPDPGFKSTLNKVI